MLGAMIVLLACSIYCIDHGMDREESIILWIGAVRLFGVVCKAEEPPNGKESVSTDPVGNGRIMEDWILPPIVGQCR